jgi:hypothetical protein
MSCAYCGGPEETRDHVPPKGIFAGLPKNQLITVPSCWACNNGESKDDDYFRQAMVAMETIEGATVPAPVVETIQRAVRRAEKEGRRTPLHALARSARKVWFWAEGASSAQLKTAVDIEWPRVRRTALRIARGLYWHHREHCVPDDFEVTIYSEGERVHFDQEQQEYWDEMCMDTLRGTKIVVHPEAFMYAINKVDADPRIVTLVLVFYKKVIFLCTVSAPDCVLDALVAQTGGSA